MTRSEALITSFMAELKRRGVSLHAAALAMGVHYSTIYFAINPKKRSGKYHARHPKFTYELGKKIEHFISNKPKEQTSK